MVLNTMALEIGTYCLFGDWVPIGIPFPQGIGVAMVAQVLVWASSASIGTHCSNSSLIKTSPLLSSSGYERHRKLIIFEWPKLMNIDYFFFTNQMTASSSWNSFVTEDYEKLRKSVASSWLFLTSITKKLLL